MKWFSLAPPFSSLRHHVWWREYKRQKAENDIYKLYSIYAIQQKERGKKQKNHSNRGAEKFFRLQPTGKEHAKLHTIGNIVTLSAMFLKILFVGFVLLVG
jgi:hypothetical protein